VWSDEDADMPWSSIFWCLPRRGRFLSGLSLLFLWDRIFRFLSTDGYVAFNLVGS